MSKAPAASWLASKEVEELPKGLREGGDVSTVSAVYGQKLEVQVSFSSPPNTDCSRQGLLEGDKHT